MTSLQNDTAALMGDQLDTHLGSFITLIEWGSAPSTQGSAVTF